MNKMIGAVVIGRNEGDRLAVCLQSLLAQVDTLVYVDSGSTDHSLDIAKKLDVIVVNLDISIPFTAARARNEGFARLMQVSPDIEYVQFVDGDCEMFAAWLPQALSCLVEDEQLAVVCGQRKERYPEKSVYNRLCDIEWDTPIGEALACGGDALIRASAFSAVDGYNASLIAGEEPEMCVRLRNSGWKILRMDADMTWHDANITRFSQWWKRAARSGHAYAEGAWMHGKTPQQHWVREVRRNWFWGLSFPVLLLMAALWAPMAWLLLIYPTQAFRIYRHSNMHRSAKDRWFFAFFCVLANFPIMFGQIKFHMNRLMGNKSRLIEYR